jgi:quercetin dioxygenase-like cupin family protein
MLSHLIRPFRPIEVDREPLTFFQLARLGEDLRREAEYEQSGRASITLVREKPVTLVLVALRKGEVMRDHQVPSDGALALLSGRVAFAAETASSHQELAPGALALFAAGLIHRVEALDDAIFLVIIGGRERPPWAPGERGN